ncbi:hypothetical protein GJ496_008979 [Pomphorhynchus laevis]|nr:hypothetical protein GJ496_008979 [Pomphorhynchus laevis]
MPINGGIIHDNASFYNPTNIYQTVLQWRPNQFHLPQCSAINTFVNILASFYDSVANKAADEKSATKTAVVFCQLILQSVNSSKVSATRKALQRRLQLWHEKNQRTI